MTKPFTYATVCSGVEAFGPQWHALGWQCAFHSEINKHAAAVLRYHYPDTPNYGDFTKIQSVGAAIDLLAGGTPCQSFSVAGRRLGMDDPRGNLAIEFLRLAVRLRARWVLFENVTGLTSSGDGRDFGAFLGLLGECGYGWAYRVLDAQYFGVPQRRRRVFVVGYLGDARPAQAVLFEQGSLRRHSASRRQASKDVAGCLTAGAADGSGNVEAAALGLLREVYTLTDGAATPRGAVRTGNQGVPVVGGTLTASSGRSMGAGTDPAVLVPVTGSTLPTSPKSDRGSDVDRLIVYQCQGNSVGPVGTLLVVDNVQSGLPFMCGLEGTDRPALTASSAAVHAHNQAPAVVADGLTAGELCRYGFYTCAFANDGDMCAACEEGSSYEEYYGPVPVAVRRMTELECERYMGYPDGWTQFGVRPDGQRYVVPASPRYRMCGNGWATPVAAWIGRRIDAVNTLISSVPANV